jgi:hypothetical protein
MAKNQAGTISANDPPSNDPPDSDNADQGGEKKAVQDVHRKMMVDQYLKRSPQGADISELIRSLYKTKIMSFEEWESTVIALLKKQVR